VVITSKVFLVGSVFSKLKLSKGLMAGLLLGGTLGSFGVAAATSTPSTTVFYACLNVKAGTMNHISTTEAPKCASGNVNTSWNATGPKGDTGSQGVAGQQGLRGLQGLTGDTGLQGLKGDAGEQGLTGLTGLQGPAGPAGADGQGIEATLEWNSGAPYTGSTSEMHSQAIGGASLTYPTANFSNFTFLKSGPLPHYAANLTADLGVVGGFCNYVCSFNFYAVHLDGSVTSLGGFAVSSGYIGDESTTASGFSVGDVLVVAGVQLTGDGASSVVSFQPSGLLVWKPSVVSLNP
jgi:hypothetical protein